MSEELPEIVEELVAIGEACARCGWDMDQTLWCTSSDRITPGMLLKLKAAWNTRTEKKWKYASKEEAWVGNGGDLEDLSDMSDMEMRSWCVGFNTAREEQP